MREKFYPNTKYNMSSKQLNFYITPEEHQKINEFIARKGAIILLKEKIYSDNKIEFQTELPTNDIFQVYLSNNEFIKKLKINTSKEKKIKYFDIDESYLLEFSLGGFYPHDRNILQRARFYYVKSFWNDQDILEKKSTDFTLWCDDFIKDFRKEFLKIFPKEKTFFYSDSAIKWIEDNNASETGGGLSWKIIS